MQKMSDTEKTKQIKQALVNHYSTRDAWVICFEVGNDTGAKHKGWADAVAMSVWPSRGYAIHGFEIKVSRSDFLKEMENPGKADVVGQHCDYWNLVTPSGLVQDSEVPEAWGLITLTAKGRLHTRRAPTKNKAAQINKGFMAALLRRRADHNTNGIHERYKHEIEEIKKQHAKEIEKKVEAAVRMIDRDKGETKAWIAEFEERLGMSFNVWESQDQIAQSLLLASSLMGDYGKLETCQEAAEELAKEIKQIMDGIRNGKS